MDEIRTKQDNLREDYQVVKGNILNEARLCDKTTLVEYRILLIALSKISPVTQSLDVCFRAEEFCKLLNLIRNGMYSHIRKASETLASRTITLEEKNNKKGVTYPWLRKISYDEAYVTLCFNPSLKKHIIDIKVNGGYTKYFIKNIIKLKSIYAVRLYEQLKQYEFVGKRIFKLSDLREKINAMGKSYNRMNNFRIHILNKAKEEINVCTDIIFDFEEIKEGRKVKEIIFYIQSKMDISNDYKTLRKDKLILLLQKEIHNLTGYIFEARHMNTLHRNILLDLIVKLKNGSFSKVFIRSPEQFFIYQLNEIINKYDIDLLKTRFQDY